MIFIEVLEPYRDLFPESVLHKAAESTLSLALDGEVASLSLQITDEENMRGLNKQFRGVDRSTDVLSFPTDFIDPDLESRYLGDVVICYPEAATQARKRGHDVQAELQLLVVHGILHLLGHDHATEDDKKAMWEFQDRILEELGLEIEVGGE